LSFILGLTTILIGGLRWTIRDFRAAQRLELLSKTFAFCLWRYGLDETRFCVIRAAAGSNGPLVVDLHPDFPPGSHASGCVAMNSTLAHNIQKDPARYSMLDTHMVI
jgi:hypothetical protein